MPGKDRFWVMKMAMAIAENHKSKTAALDSIARWKKFFKRYKDNAGLRVLDRIEKVIIDRFDW